MKRQRVVERVRSAVDQRIALRPRNPRPPGPNKEMRDNRDDGEDEEASDEQGVEFLRFGFRQT